MVVVSTLARAPVDVFSTYSWPSGSSMTRTDSLPLATTGASFASTWADSPLARTTVWPLVSAALPSSSTAWDAR